MGLAAPRKRRKIGHDPNNTAWTRDNTTYGHRILTSQGWTPGSYLGAKDAAHASLHTGANASHIRVTLKEGNLGLGARQPGAAADPLADETFGLGRFQDLLGRLNGKSDLLLEKERKARDHLEREKYLERKWGAKGGMGKFVSGGFLVGDRILDEHTAEASKDGSMEDSPKDSDVSMEDETASSARKHSEEEKSNRKKGSKKEKKEEKKKLQQQRESSVTDTAEERRKRKLEKRARKEAKRNAQALSHSERHDLEEIKSETVRKSEDTTMLAVEDSRNLSTQTVEIIQTKTQPNPQSGRNMARQRYIKHKRMSMMDPAALKEILMLKS